MAYIGKRPEDIFRGLASKASFTGDGKYNYFRFIRKRFRWWNK